MEEDGFEEMEDPKRIKLKIPCPGCSDTFFFSRELTGRYFTDGGVVHSCGAKIDWWKAINGQFLDGNPASAFSLVHSVAINLTVDKKLGIQYEDIGVKGRWKVVHWKFYNLSAGVDPVVVEPHYGTGSFRFGFLRHHTSSAEKVTGLAQVIVAFDHGDYHHQKTVEALQAFVRGSYKDCILPAHLMIELGVHKLTAMVLKELNIPESKQFMNSALQHSNRVNKFLPMICALVGFPTISDNLRTALNKLTTCRNNLAHYGEIQEETNVSTRKDFADLMTAAFIFNHYTKLLEAKVKQWIVDRKSNS